MGKALDEKHKFIAGFCPMSWNSHEVWSSMPFGCLHFVILGHIYKLELLVTVDK